MRTNPRCDTGVSEILGALLLIAIVSLAVGIIGVAILSSTETSQIPSISVRITNVSRTIYLAHEGGDSLPAGYYRIYVDGTDRTDSFTDTSSGINANSTVFKAGMVLKSDGYFLPPDQGPRIAMLVYRGPDGAGAVLVTKYFTS